MIYYEWFIKSIWLNYANRKLFIIKGLCRDFPTGAEKVTVLGVVDPLNVLFHHSHTHKILPWVQSWLRDHACDLFIRVPVNGGCAYAEVSNYAIYIA